MRNHPRSFLPVPIRLAAGALVAGAAGLVGLGATPAASAQMPRVVSVNFTAAAAAPVAQITEDEPSATFHPEGEGEYGYALVTANPAVANALSAVVWPGAAAGNAGTLITVLGGPSALTALNDPVQASAATGTSQTQSSLGSAPGPVMTASVVPSGSTDQHATASSAMAGGGLGAAGTVGGSTSTSTIDFDSSTAVLSVTAHSQASDFELGGVVKIGSVTSSASATATNGVAPTLTGATNFHDMTIAGEEAYVDGSGFHLGSPGAPAGPAAVDSVDAALAAAGMQVYFTAPHTITVGGVSYYYASSVLFYWAPPNDTSNNSFTMSLGGAAVSVSDSPQADDSGFALDTGGSGSTGTGSSSPIGTTGSGGQGATAASSSPLLAGTAASPVASLPAGGAPGDGAPGAGATLALPASPSAAASTAGAPEAAAVPAGVRLPGGVGAGWVVFAVLAGLLGAGLTTRVPGLLNRQAAATCPRARNNPRARNDKDRA
jgi:hypothetical protein